MAMTQIAMGRASAKRVGEGSRVAVSVAATVPRAMIIALEYATLASRGELESVGDGELSAKAGPAQPRSRKIALGERICLAFMRSPD